MRSGGERCDRPPGHLRRACAPPHAGSPLPRRAHPFPTGMRRDYSRVTASSGRKPSARRYSRRRRHIRRPAPSPWPAPARHRCAPAPPPAPARTALRALRAVVAFEVNEAKLHLQIDHVGRQRQPAFEHRDGFVEASDLGEKAADARQTPAEMAAAAPWSGAIGRGPRRAGPRRPSNGKQGFDRRIIAAARRPFQRRRSPLRPGSASSARAREPGLRGHCPDPISILRPRAARPPRGAASAAPTPRSRADCWSSARCVVNEVAAGSTSISTIKR